VQFKDDFKEIIISGAGPAGCTASLFFSKNKIKHTLVDKAIFPRDKICGDGLSGKVLSVLRSINESYVMEIVEQPKLFHPSKGIIFVSPDGTKLSIPFKKEYKPEDNAPGFVAKRLDFDNFLFEKTKSDYCHCIQNAELKNIDKIEDGLNISFEINAMTELVKTKLLIAADGSRSIAAKKLANLHLDPNHYSGGIRTYYKGVKDLDPNGFIELIFIKKYLPGYFWIFPLPNGEANVGAGMLTAAISKRKVDLKKMLIDTIENDPQISPRFKEAILLDKIHGWGLPLGSKKRNLSGDHFMLCGDAASLIDPFTGEGIAPAMYSGKWAALHAIKAIEKGDFSAQFLKAYDKEVYAKTWGEIRLSYLMQKLTNFTWLFNFVVGKASRNQELKNTIISMFDNIDLRKQFTNPMFYFRLLFKR
jgi:geranylgeranyl reductase family protein